MTGAKSNQGYMVRIIRKDASSITGHLTMFAAVLAESGAAALEAVKVITSEGDDLKVDDARLSSETINALSLKPNIAHII